MDAAECGRSIAVLEAARAGRQDAELRLHIESCPECAALFVVVSALREDRAAMMRLGEPPTSGAMWWRIERRTRREAARRAARSVTAVQVAAVATGAGVALALAGIGWLSGMALPVLPPLARWVTPAILGLVAWGALAPAALYFALTDE